MGAGDAEQRRKDDRYGGYLNTEINQGVTCHQGRGGDGNTGKQAVLTALPDTVDAEGDQPAEQAHHQGKGRNAGFEGKFEIAVGRFIMEDQQTCYVRCLVVGKNNRRDVVEHDDTIEESKPGAKSGVGATL